MPGLRTQGHRENFANAATFNHDAALIMGMVRGIHAKDIEHFLLQKTRYQDKRINELAKGKAMGNFLRPWRVHAPARRNTAAGNPLDSHDAMAPA